MNKQRGIVSNSPFTKRRPINISAVTKARGVQHSPAVTPNYPSYSAGGEFATQ